MIRGTTPLMRFCLPFNADLLDEVYITIAQNGETVIEKSMKDCDTDENNLAFRMTQEDTLKFEDGQWVEIQMRVRMKSGEALASQIERTTVQRILKDGVI